MTLREFQALQKVHDGKHRFTVKLFEGILASFEDLQVTLHNIHFRGQQHPRAFTRDELYGRQRPQTVEEKKQALALIFTAAKKKKAGEEFTDYNDPITKVG